MRIYLLLAGSSLLALVSALKLPEKGQMLPDTFGVFLAALVCAVFALVLLRSRYQKLEPSVGALSGKEAEIRQSLQALLDALQQLQQDLPELSNDAVKSRLEGIFDRCIFPLTEIEISYAVESITVNYLLGQAAHAERLMNRMWSAAADGQRDEVTAVCSEVAGLLENGQIADAKK